MANKITRTELKDYLKGFGLAIGGWLVVVPAQEMINKAGLNSVWMGIIIILFILWLD